MIESVNYQLRKVSKNRGHFHNDDAALKLLRLVARDITTTRGGVAGTGTWNWKTSTQHPRGPLPRPPTGRRLTTTNRETSYTKVLTRPTFLIL
jgi:hypothetical protein